MGLVEAHGGKLELLDRPGGATFRVSLPTGVGPEAAAPEPVSAPEAWSGRTALIVDDEPEIADALAEFLGLEGYRCDTAGGGTEAVSRLATATYDLIVSDLRMPDMDGPALFAWIKRQRPELAARTCFATGDTLGAPAVRFLSREGRPVIEKPFTPESLRRLLDEMAA
jgi:CheY-like chemotaxis protein